MNNTYTAPQMNDTGAFGDLDRSHDRGTAGIGRTRAGLGSIGAGALHVGPLNVGPMNVSNVERWASVVAGVGFLAMAARRRRTAAIAASTIGTGLIARGITGRCPVYTVAHTSSRLTDTKAVLGGDRGVHVNKTMTINKPVEEVYRFWRDLTNLPKVMRHLESVTTTGDRQSHWVAKGPAGMRVEWDAEIIHEEADRVIGWRSLENAEVVSAGSVAFREAPHGGTEITVRLQYEPPAGKVGAAIAKLFGEEPSQTIDDDLRHVKQFLETGEVSSAEDEARAREQEHTGSVLSIP
jgi:uncharacterized membrane protein